MKESKDKPNKSVTKGSKLDTKMKIKKNPVKHKLPSIDKIKHTLAIINKVCFLLKLLSSSILFNSLIYIYN